MTNDAKCGCYACSDWQRQATTMIVCEKCGNKRCPHATDHRHECTNSNEPGQPGSRYPKVGPLVSHAEQELPASSVSAASVSPSQGSLGSEASDVQQPATARGPHTGRCSICGCYASPAEQVTSVTPQGQPEQTAPALAAGPSAVEEVQRQATFSELYAVAYVHAEALDRLRAENAKLRKQLDALDALAEVNENRAVKAEAALRLGVVVPELALNALLNYPGIKEYIGTQIYDPLAAAKDGRSNG